MPTRKQITKAIAKTLLSLSILGAYITKYGLNFTADVTKTALDAATNMANYFTDGKMPKLGIGDTLFNKAVAGANWTLDQAIKLQKGLKKKIR